MFLTNKIWDTFYSPYGWATNLSRCAACGDCVSLTQHRLRLVTITHMWWKQKSLYINCTVSFFHKIDSDIWASFGLKTENSEVLLKYPTFKGCFTQLYRYECRHNWVPHRSSPSVSTFFPISGFSYFIIRFLNHIFFVINFSYFVIRFYYRAIK